MGSVLAFATGDPNPINALTIADAATIIVIRRSTEVLEFMARPHARKHPYDPG
jgi:hypothetical protein